ncbi:MAG TPA: signal peptidase II [Thermoflexales bacterium]|jgi:signal peptidase II|nr:signal peptidase II [Thermoflexales bacterium]HQY23375.1 signal peptidase II [Thermoflexales bacterium]HQZ52007.1 signal peptidase II [Thermoflexales bacterium]HRA52176.1 signal peptidase II [Thermoflexales bacterium]
MENPATTQDPVIEQPARASRFADRYGVLLVVAALALVADQVSKRLIEANIAPYQNTPIFDFLVPYLTFTRTQNTGSAFSLFPDGGIVFFVVFIFVAGLILYYAPRLPADDRLSRVALGLQLGGAFGNIVDRLRQGYVTDFIHLRIPQIGFDWPVSNVADICIVGGVVILFLLSFRKEPVSSVGNVDNVGKV